MDELDFLMNTNFKSCFHLSQLCHPLLKEAATKRQQLRESLARGESAQNAVWTDDEQAKPAHDAPASLFAAEASAAAAARAPGAGRLEAVARWSILP